MLSIILPTKNRPDQLNKFVDSIFDTAESTKDIVVI